MKILFLIIMFVIIINFIIIGITLYKDYDTYKKVIENIKRRKRTIKL